MKMLKSLKSLNRNLIYLVIAAVVVIVMFLTEPANAITPHGVFLPSSKHAYPARAVDNVKVYNQPVYGAKTIGLVRVERHFTKQNKASELEVLRYARGIAAKAGANGLVVKTFFGTPQAGLERRYILLAKAIIK